MPKLVQKKPLYVILLVNVFILLLLAPGMAVAQFTAGNLTVLRVGDGVTGLTSSAQPLTVVEYTTSGVATGVTVPLPSFGAAPYATNSGSAVSEGQMTMSAERDRLVVVGYNAVSGTANIATSPSATYSRELFTINSGAISTYAASTSTLYSGNNIRSGTASGTNYFAGGPASGSSLLNTNTVLTAAVINTRVIQVFNGQTYFSSGSGTNLGVLSLGTNIPTTCCQATTLLNTPNSGSAYGFSFSPDGNTLYIADDGLSGSTPGISKYTKSGATYALAYVVNTTTCRSIAVDYSGANPVIYAATASSTAPNSIIKITDAGAASPVTTLVASSPANTVFRSITFAPSCTAAISVLGASTVCSGTNASIIIKGNPTGIVSYNINGGTTLSTTIKPNGFDTVSIGSVTATATVNLVSITTQACSAVPVTGSVTVNVFPVASVTSISTDGPLCAGFDLHMNAAINATTGPYTYTWSGPAYSSGTSSSALLTSSVTVTAIPTLPANPVYTLTVTNGNSCVTNATVTTTVNPLPIAYTVFGSGSYCAGGTGVDVQLNNSQTGVNYQLFNTSGTVGGVRPGTTGTPIDFGSQPAGTYTVSAINPTTGCSNNMTGAAAITVNPLPAVITGSMTVCPGTTTALTDASGGTWNSGSPGNATIGGGTGIVTGVTGNTTATITYTLPTTCFITATVTVNPLPLSIAGGNAVCMGSSISLSDATGGGTWISSNTGVATIGSGSGAVTPVFAGTSTISYVLPTGCMANEVITVNPLPAGITGTTNVCVGATITLTDAGGGTWSSSNTTAGTVSALGSVTGIASGTTNITYTLPTTCMVSTPITVNPLPTNILGNPSVCIGYTTSLSDLTPGGAWTSGAPGIASVGSTGIVTGVFTGTSNIFYTISSTGCFLFTAVTVNPLPLAISGPSAVCAGSVATYTDASTGGTWSSSNTGIATIGAGTGSLSAIMAGTTSITYTIGSGCTTSSIITVNPLLAAIFGTASVCQGLTTGLTDGTGGGTWSSSVPGFGTVDASGNVMGISAGAFYVSYTLPTSCFTTTTFTVNPLPGPINGPTNICAGSSTVLTDAAGGGTWISSSASFVSINASSGFTSGIMGGTSDITYTLPTGCFMTKGITVNPLPSAITGTGSVCVGSSVSLSDLTGGGTWSSSNTLYATVGSTTGIVTGTGAGNPVITYTLPSSCYTTFIATVNPLPSLASGTLAVCMGATSTLIENPAGGTWMSNAPGTASIGLSTGTVTANTVGNATITYTSLAGCVNTQIVTVNPLPPAITGTLQVCPGATTTLTDAISGGTWSSLSIGIAVVGLASGTVTGVSANTVVISYLPATGCGTFAIVTVNPLPGAVAGSLAVCTGFTSALSDAATGGTWSSSASGTASIAAATGLMTGVTPGTASITYTLPTGCYITATVTVYAVPGTITGTETVCPGATTTLSDLPSGGTWSVASPGTATVGAGSGVVSGVAAGTATLTYTIAGGCTATSVITVNPLPAAISGNMHACLGHTSALSDTDGGGTWSSSSSATASVDGAGVVTGNTAGTATITYTLPTGCTRTTIFTVDTLPHPILFNTPVCTGSSITLSDAGGGTWASGTLSVAAISLSSGTVTGISAGTSIITYTLPTGCITTAITTVSPLPATITGGPNVCDGQAITLSDATAGGSWISSDPFIATVGSGTGVVTGVATGSATITYTASVTGCKATLIVSVIALPPAITGTMTICAGVTTTLNNAASGGTWSAGAPAIAGIGSTGVVTGMSAGTSGITYTVVGGCISTTVVTINPLPAAISGMAAICAGLTATLSDATAGGTWFSSNTAVSTIGTSGLVTSVSAGTSNVTYTLPTGCITVRTVTINPLPGAITGSLYLCAGADAVLTDGATGGLWSIDPSASGVASVFAVTGDVLALSAGTATITYTLPTGCTTTAVITVNPIPLSITGTTSICVGASTTLTDVTPGGTWSSSNTTLATIGAATGTVSGMSQGAPVITYKLPSGCITTIAFIVNPLPVAITGNRSICKGTATALSDASVGGTWSITHPDSIGVASGIVTGDSLGTDTVTYTLPTGCITVAFITVNPFPAAILGDTLGICQGYNILLSDSTHGGAWSTANPAIATVTSAGTVAGFAAGTADIYYTLPTGCGVAAVVTVNPLFPISGNTSVCLGETIFLSDLATGGTWSSGTPLVATVNSTGEVTGTSSGAADITYHLVTGCIAAIAVTVNSIPALYIVTGGGSYCSGGTGLDIGLNGSDDGISYQLRYSGSAIDTLPGSGSALDFGLFTLPGAYTVLATDSITGCSATMTGSAMVIVNPTVTPFVSIGTSGGTTICAGTAADFTALTVNGGSAPLYQWSVNGAIAGSGPEYSYVPLNGDVVSIVLISNAACVTSDSAIASVTMTTVSEIAPSVSLAVSPGDSVCPGTPVTVIPSTTTGGVSPTFQWIKNGIEVGSGLTYTFLPTDGDNVFCRMHSDMACAVPDTVHSDNNINMHVPPIYVPDVTISAYPGTRIESGDTVTLVASVTFSGLSFSYQWKINNAPVAGATTDTFKSSLFNNMDVVSCDVTGNSLCGTASRSAQVLIVDTIALGVQGVQPVITDLRLMPNPNNGTFTIKGTIGMINEVSVVITDMVGQTVYKNSVPVNNGKINQEISIGGAVANGMYLLEVTSGTVNKFLYFAVGQ